jgi:hypothetical protein
MNQIWHRGWLELTREDFDAILKACKRMKKPRNIMFYTGYPIKTAKALKSHLVKADGTEYSISWQ